MNSSKVLEIFKEITRIPRESGHEEPMTAFLQQFAKERNLECKTDLIGNVCISKPASPGKEHVPTLVLQGHQDMVCEKLAGSNHDFLKDPINYVIENGWMIAKETFRCPSTNTCLEESFAAENAGLEMELFLRRSRESAREAESAAKMESLLARSESGSCDFVVSCTTSDDAALL